MTRARELREQIAAHLDEALPPDADDEAVQSELDRLGTPRALAAAAVGPVSPSAGARMRNMLSHVRWWAWASAVLIVAVVAGVIGYVIAVETAPPLSDGGMFAWYFPQDAERSVITTVGRTTQLTVPERYHQRQGFLVSLDNDTDWTQTIIGLDSSRQIWSLQTPSIAIGNWPHLAESAWTPSPAKTRWIFPAAIPPHSTRVLRVLWTSNSCQEPGTALGFSNVYIRVRVGLITKTENVQLLESLAISGTKASQC